jgi:hypothetical protein
MDSNIIERLFASFNELEGAITKARETFKRRESIPDTVIKRLESYDTILAKQRALAVSLCESISKRDWDEVNRNVGLINGLSAMIRDDARAILAAVTVSDELEEKELGSTENFC